MTLLGMEDQTDVEYSKDARASNAICVGFSRNIDDFPVNRYMQILEVGKGSGYYLKIVPAMVALAELQHAREFMHKDGADELHPEPAESFEFRQYKTERFSSGFSLSALPQPVDWRIVEQHSRIHAQRMMTKRTLRAIGVITDEANYAPGHVGDVRDIVMRLPHQSARQWDEGTIRHPVIRESLDRGARMIHKATNGLIRRSDLRLVVAPGLATKMGTTLEVAQYVAEEGFGSGRYEHPYGLPDRLYGVEIVVENAVRVSATAGMMAPEFAMPEGVAALVARVGGLVQEPADVPAGSEAARPLFSFLTQMTLQDMDVVRKTKPEPEKATHLVIDNVATVCTAPVSGFLFKNVA